MTVGAIAGISVGAALIFLGGVALFVFYCRRTRRLDREAEAAREERDRQDEAAFYYYHGSGGGGGGAVGPLAGADHSDLAEYKDPLFLSLISVRPIPGADKPPPPAPQRPTAALPRHPAYRSQIMTGRRNDGFGIAPAAFRGSRSSSSDGTDTTAVGLPPPRRPSRQPVPSYVPSVEDSTPESKDDEDGEEDDDDDDDKNGLSTAADARSTTMIHPTLPPHAAVVSPGSGRRGTVRGPRGHPPPSMAATWASHAHRQPTTYYPPALLPPGSAEAAAAISPPILSPVSSAWDGNATTRRRTSGSPSTTSGLGAHSRSRSRSGSRSRSKGASAGASALLGLFVGGSRAEEAAARRGYEEVPVGKRDSDLY